MSEERAMSVMRCKCRRQAETGLRCVRCSVPICPECSRSAPVGFLCRQCADNKRDSPLYQVSMGSLALGYAGSLGVALFGGWVMAYIGRPLGFFGFLLAFVYGIVVGETGLRIVNRRRGLPIEIMAGVCAFLGLVGGVLIDLVTRHSVFALHANGAGAWNLPIYLSVLLLNPLTYVLVGIAIYGAVSRIRSL